MQKHRRIYRSFPQTGFGLWPCSGKYKPSNIGQGGWSSPEALRGFAFVLCLFGALMAGINSPAGATEGSGDRVEWFGNGPKDRWAFGGEFYLWGAGVGGRTAGGDKIDIGFSDLVKDLNLGFMATLAAAKGKATLFADFLYMDVSDDTKSTAYVIGYPVRADVNVDLKAFVSTFGGAYSFLETGSTRLNLLAGGRYLWLKGQLKYDINGGLIKGKITESGHTLDGIVGLRGKTDINDKWYLTYYGDVGTGDSKLTWQALGAISYRFSKADAVIGYRYLDYDFRNAKVIDNLNLSGPFAGFKMSF